MDISKKPAGGKKPPAPASKNRGKNSVASARPRARRSDEGSAFLPDPYDGAGAKARTGDELAEVLAEEFVSSATNGEEMAEDRRNEIQTEEIGGPFTETTAAEEFDPEPDASNPPDGEREPFPTATRSGNG